MKSNKELNMINKLSERQESILIFIKDFLDEHSYPPTVRDIQTGCSISSTSVVDYNLRILQRDGYLKRETEVSRGIELLGSNKPKVQNLITVPILSNIAAGEPLPVNTQENWNNENTETLDLPSFLVNGKENVFGVRVKGQSMMDAFITDGDLVLLEPVQNAANGEMVAAWIQDNQEVTLKHFYLENGIVRLQPANPNMDPIYVPADKVSVQGRVVGVIRSVN
ncbi:MAG: repressor LexA [Chloroflexi bacterium]|jgi:repressor LexA|nr:MAG: repressor LexA [Chloroflexota bacterium]